MISQNKSIFIFNKLVGFKLHRKQLKLRKLVRKISTQNYVGCKKCSYKVYKNIFFGRTKEQKEWGAKRKKVIKFLGREGETGSREIEKILGFLPRHPKGKNVNHHYELIKKRKIGKISKTEWFWSLNEVGVWIYKNLLQKGKEISTFFDLITCPICEQKLDISLRKKWRDSDFESDIFWDYVKKVEEIDVEKEVYDVVLPNKPKNNHMFVANGFIVHNSAGLSLPVFRVIIKSLKRYSGRWGMNWIPVLEYLQMAGRAGRPEYESFGEAISIAKSQTEKEDIYEKYVLGEPEEIYSKVAVEPVLRTYVLSLISSGIIRDTTTMKEFFSKTFWAHQFKDMPKLESIMDKMVTLLQEWEFITVQGNTKDDFTAASDINKPSEATMRATLLGKRISELYLDPLTARHLLDCLQQFNSQSSFSLLQMISHTLEMRPLLRIKVKQQEFIQEELTKKYDQLLEKEPSAYDLEYEDFMNSIKTALYFEAWIDEKEEDYLLEKFDIRPGEIRMKNEAADWLLYAAEELSNILLYRNAVKEIRKLRIRIKNGVREELLPLLKLKGVGRVRARKLFAQGIKDLGDIKTTDITSLAQILSPKLAVDIKKQVGQEVKEIPKGTRKGQLSMSKFTKSIKNN